MTAYYNENNPHAAAWLRDLIRRGLIPDGTVDTRSIVDVEGSELRSFEQVHLFAGIGGWPLALRLAGVGDLRCWTGSCPCQPFSVAGKRKGADDKRHLWPEMRRLLEVCRPAKVFGEQVASKDGRSWLAGVRTDLEGMGYEVGASDLCAAGIGAPHIRQRLWWVAHSDVSGSQGRPVHSERPVECVAGSRGLDGRMADTEHAERRAEHEINGISSGRDRSRWSGCSSVSCGDGKTRRIKPGLAPLAHGIPGRVGLLRGYGNAIVPPLAAEFIAASLEAISDVSKDHTACNR